MAPSGDGAAAEAWVKAGKRRAAQGEADAELENLLRAFELDAASPVAAAALSLAYTSRELPRKGPLPERTRRRRRLGRAASLPRDRARPSFRPKT